MPTTHAQSLSELRAAHTPGAIRARLSTVPNHSYLRDIVYGAIDGTVTTFAIVSGVAGAGLSSEVIIILGVANLVADGFSMAAGNFLGTRTEQQQRERARLAEEMHIEKHPEGEREEIRRIFANKGFDGEPLEHIVATITSDRKQWVDTMMREELGMTLHGPSPWRAALWTLAAFVVLGFVPLSPFVLPGLLPASLSSAYTACAAMTAMAFFVVGAVKARFTAQRWYWGGLETLAIGGTAAALAFAVGRMLSRVAAG